MRLGQVNVKGNFLGLMLIFIQVDNLILAINLTNHYDVPKKPIPPINI